MPFDPDMELTKAEGARLGGISRQVYGRRVERGVHGPTLGALHSYATAAGDQETCERIEEKYGPPPARRGSASASADGLCPICGTVRDLSYWKTRREKESFLKTRLERYKLQGSLITRSVAEEKVANLGAMMRQLLESIGGDLRDELAAETDPRRCGDLVDDAIRSALTDASERLGHEADETEEPGEEADEE